MTRGEKGHHVIFYKTLNITERDETGEETEKRIPLMRGFTVFNVEQCDGIEELPKPKAIPHAERYIANIGATMHHGGNGAYFNVGKDFIQLPHAGYFRDIESYYAASLHEHTHWTGHKSRLDRTDFATRYGSEAYAFEELVAEMGSAFACANLGITSDIEGHASYLDSWLTMLGDDKRAIFRAASLANKAAEYLDARQNKSQAA